MEITVKNRKIISDGSWFVSGNVNSFTVHVGFEDTERIGWNELNKKIVFKNSESKIAIPLFDSDIIVPWEVLQKDERLYITVIGTQEEPYKKVVTEKMRTGILIKTAGMETGKEPEEPTPGLAEQILAAAEEAKKTAESLRQDADKGVFDGKDGYNPVKGKDYWTPEEVEEIVEAPKRAEESRVTAENSRVNAENAREEAETERETAEGQRKTEENARADNEAERKTAESGRAEAERLRAEAETDRDTAEKARATEEGKRTEAEILRAEAEAAREEFFGSVEGEISELNSALADYIYINENANLLDTSKLIDGSLHPTTGNIVDSTFFKVSDNINVNTGDKLYFYFKNNNGIISSVNCVRRICEYNGTEYLGYSDYPTNGYEVGENTTIVRIMISVNNPYDYYMVFVNPTHIPPTDYIPYSDGKVIDIAKKSDLDDVTNKVSEFEGGIVTPVSGAFNVPHDNVGYITKIGVITSDERYFHTNSIRFIKGTEITVTSNDPSSTNISRISEWTEDGRFIRMLAPGSSSQNTVTVTLEHDAFVRFCGYEGRVFDCSINGINIPENIENAIKSVSSQLPDNRYWAYNVWKVLCIGDSLTSGATFSEAWGSVAEPGKSIDQNYPRILGRMINAEVTNAGISGRSASTWYTNDLANYDFSDYDTFIIWLGTNNGLTPTLDTDVDPYNDYHDYAETETGYFCKIIESIKEQNNSCLIVIVKVFASGGSVTYTNAALEQIATRYGCLLIDNSDLSYELHPELHANVNNPHFGKSGNVFIANRLVTEIGKYISEDPMSGEYGYSQRTN